MASEHFYRRTYAPRPDRALRICLVTFWFATIVACACGFLYALGD